ncbi:family 1 glycosylhydrolase [Georgenia sp. Z1491]|uniref:family 1 glycosylhydrolase n=1 Tax=Georgenia sp. Z1491 TaxID=3416707 RepID=UPI003CF899DC
MSTSAPGARPAADDERPGADLLPAGGWLAPGAVELVDAEDSLVDGGAAAAEVFAAQIARAADAGRACVVVLAPDPDPTRESVGRRAELARAAVAAAGTHDVAAWLTVRDPLRVARTAGAGDVGRTLAALHHALLGHGAAATALREAGAGVVGTAVHLEVTRPADPSSAPDLAAALEADLLTNHVVLGPLLDGSYPVEARAATAPAGWDHVRPGDLVAIRRGLDVLVVEHSGTRTARRAGRDRADATGAGTTVRPAGTPGADDVELVHAGRTPGGREADPSGLYEVLAALDNAYLGTPLLGLVPTGAGEVGHGPGLAAHEEAARRAATDGADVRGLLATAS